MDALDYIFGIAQTAQIEDIDAATGTQRVYPTHGSVAIMARWLTDYGLEALGFKTEYADADESWRLTTTTG